MARSRELTGRIENPQRPVFEPLESLAGRAALAWFDCYAVVVLCDETELHVYRHWITGGHHLYLERSGRPWIWRYPDADRYRPASASEALQHGWPAWWLDGVADPAEIASHAAALEWIQRPGARFAA